MLSSSSSSSLSSILQVRVVILIIAIIIMIFTDYDNNNNNNVPNLNSVLPVFVHAWGKQGHEMIGNVAYSRLQNITQNRVNHILTNYTITNNNNNSSNSSNSTNDNNNDEQPNCSSLCQVADWADTARYTQAYHWTGPLHYIDVRNDKIIGGCPVIDINDSLTNDTNNSHNNNNDNNNCHFVYNRDCVHDFCVAGAIVNYTHRLHDSNDDNDDMAISLMFLVHFIGDIHQPLHVARTTDRGGNSIHVHFSSLHDDDGMYESSSIATTTTSRRAAAAAALDHHCLDSTTTRRLGSLHHRCQLHYRQHHQQRRHYPIDNLHAVWDDSIIERAMKELYNSSRIVMEHAILNRIHNATQSGEIQQWLECTNNNNNNNNNSTGVSKSDNTNTNKNCTSKWAQESLVYALQYAYKNVDGVEILNGTNISMEYYHSRLPIVMEQLAKAAVRLANTIEATIRV